MMLENFWNKKEKPFQGFGGFGGGAGGLAVKGASGDLGASGGVIGEYTDPGPGNVYRVHVFQSPGTFIVESPAVTAVEYLVVAGGGGGSEGANSGAGGGAGGFRTNVPGTPGSHTTAVAFPVSTSPGEYAVTVGRGGVGAIIDASYSYHDGANGEDSSFGPITATGGGWGGGQTPTTATGHPGGSGGGGSTTPGSTVYPGGAAIAVTTPSPWPGPATQGFAGGSGRHTPGVWESGGGGGGAGHAGEDASPSPPASGGGAGGIGIRSPITGPAYTIGYDGSPTSIGGWVAGGGGGYYDVSPDSRGGGGTWDGSSELPDAPLSGGGDAFTFGYPGATNSGGGGGSAAPQNNCGGGGPGIVAVRYQISELGGTSQATGGNVSFYEGKTIHTFTNSGSLVCPTSISDVEYVIVGGGGGGGATGQPPGANAAGGGGAGQYLEGSGVTLPATTYPVTVGQGGDRWVRWSIPASTNNPTGEGKGTQGGASTFNSITAGGGGYGGNFGRGTGGPPFGGGDGMAGSPAGKGSGGGKAAYDNGPAGAGSGGPGGYPGGANPPTSISAGAGGGGAGGAGQDGTDGLAGGKGGVGLQLPATFRDPKARYGLGPGDPAPYHWVAGGGGGGSSQPTSPGSNAASGAGGGGVNGTEPFPSAPEAQSTPYAGGGYGGYALSPTDVKDGGEGFFGGGGGGAGSWGGGGYASGGNGGMGIVLIAYPT